MQNLLRVICSSRVITLIPAQTDGSFLLQSNSERGSAEGGTIRSNNYLKPRMIAIQMLKNLRPGLFECRIPYKCVYSASVFFTKDLQVEKFLRINGRGPNSIRVGHAGKRVKRCPFQYSHGYGCHSDCVRS